MTTNSCLQRQAKLFFTEQTEWAVLVGQKPDTGFQFGRYCILYVGFFSPLKLFVNSSTNFESPPPGPLFSENRGG